MKDSTQLLDLLAAVGSEDIEPTKAAAGRQALYPDVRFSRIIFSEQICLFWLWLQYLSAATLLAGVKAGELHQGHFNANQYNYLEGSVPVPAFTKPVLLVGRENMNRAVNGDVVVIEIFDKKEWKAPADEVVDQDGKIEFRYSSLKDPHLTNHQPSYSKKRRCWRFWRRGRWGKWWSSRERIQTSSIRKTDVRKTTYRSDRRDHQTELAGVRYLRIMNHDDCTWKLNYFFS